MQVTIENITPAQAREWLERNTKNRPIRQRHVDRLAADMTEDRWNKDGAPFRFDRAETLLDGQHRLHAIVKANRTLRDVVVVRGLDKDSFTTMDTGAKRSTSDALHIRGEQNYSILSGALGIIVEYLNHGIMGHKLSFPTTNELIDVLDTAPGIRDSVRLVVANKTSAKSRTASQAMLIPPTLMSALHYLMAEKSKPLADAFVAGMANGFDQTINPSFHVLRERMIGAQLSRLKNGREYVAALCIKAWNAERKKNAIKQLKFIDGEDFPTIQ